MSANMTSNLSTIYSGEIATMPSWMSISEGETIGTDLPAKKTTLKQKLSGAGSSFKHFFGDHAKMYRV
jgi:hypothetical protein